MTEEKGAIDFIVEEFKKELKKDIYGENKMVENESRPSKPKPKARTQQQIQLEKLMEDKKSKEIEIGGNTVKVNISRNTS